MLPPLLIPPPDWSGFRGKRDSHLLFSDFKCICLMFNFQFHCNETSVYIYPLLSSKSSFIQLAIRNWSILFSFGFFFQNIDDNL